MYMYTSGNSVSEACPMLRTWMWTKIPSVPMLLLEISGVYAYSVSLQAKCWTGNDLCLEFHILQIHFKKIIIYMINTNNIFGV